MIAICIIKLDENLRLSGIKGNSRCPNLWMKQWSQKLLEEAEQFAITGLFHSALYAVLYIVLKK
jgi:hypothetical protein